MRLPIEDDCRPFRSKNDLPEVDYEKHVRTLAERLREANKAAGQHSKLSHEVAKRYYGRQTKLEKFVKGHLVYVHSSNRWRLAHIIIKHRFKMAVVVSTR